MNQKTLLIIFSYKYPFEPPVEQFLDDEMHYLANEDVDILLMPISREFSDKRYPLIEGKGKIVLWPIKRDKINNELLHGFWFLLRQFRYLIKDLKRIRRLVKHEYRGYAVKETVKQYTQGGALYKEIKDQLPQDILSDRKRIILYSYWLSPVVVAEIYLKQYLNNHCSTDVEAYSRAHGDGDLYHIGLEQYRPCLELMNHGIDCFFSISEDGKERLEKQGIQSVKTCRLGVEKRDCLVAQNNDVPLIVSCSVINDNKRVNRIAEILSFVKSGISWVHFGGGPNEQELKEYCESHIPQNVKWKLMGWTAHDEIMLYFQTNHPDLFVNVSRVEGIPVSIMEALSFSTPCIATNTGAVREIIMDDEDGFLIPVEFDAEEIAKLIDSFLQKNDKEKKRMREKAFLVYDGLFNASKNYSAFARMIVTG